MSSFSGDNVSINQLHTDLQLASAQIASMQKLMETMAAEFSGLRSEFQKFAREQAVAGERAIRDREELAELREQVKEIKGAYERLKGQFALINWLVYIVPIVASAVGYIASATRK